MEVARFLTGLLGTRSLSILVENVLLFRLLVKKILLLLLIVGSAAAAYGQCNELRPQKDISFNTDQDCAPVTVTQFRITYYFNVPQNPATIAIMYDWNDPASTVTLVDQSNGLIAGGGNTSFTANATLTYFDNNGQCSILPTAYIVINGTVCASSAQQQVAYFWGTDEQANAQVSMSPQNWDVCFDNPIVNARFSDNSEFNCNPTVEPDNPNRFARHVQFVYGTNNIAATGIRDLSLNDGSIQQLTNGSGALASSSTRGTGSLTVTAAYFGPVDTVPFPADGPTSVSFPMSAPANVANAIGNQFEITLFNWNTCNPWNGDAVNPNYEDAIITRGYVRIVEAPQPAFFTRDANGNPTSDFCIGDVISFRNSTPNAGAYSYTWEFYDDAAGTTLLATRNQTNPTFSFSSGGTKLIRLRASNAAAQGSCVEEITGTVNITPSLTAHIGVTDLSGNPITPDFCQEFATPLADFDVRFTDISSGTVTASTVWRWEFYDQNNNLAFEAPSGGGFSNSALGPFDRTFTNRGIYRVRLRVRDNVTGCESSDEAQVRVFEKPKPAFSFNRVCETSATSIADLSTLNAIAGEKIILWEWDMNYDGSTFNKDAALDNKRNFDYTFPAAGTYNVAVRVTTDGAACAALLAQEVVVDALPNADFTADKTSGCSALSVTFTNNSVAGQPDQIKEYVWEVDDGSGFEADSVQRPTDPGFSSSFVRTFFNTGTTDLDYQVRLRVVTANGCETTSAPLTITVFPQPRSGFVSLNYSPFNDNCSPVLVKFAVDNQTKSLNPTDYTWVISDVSGPVDQISTGTTPSFQYSFVNATQVVKDFFITLRATLPSSCYGDSTRTIRISPVPSSDFSIDTSTYACDRVVLALAASQKGLSQYTWTISINGVVVFSTVSGEESLEYEVVRSTTTDQNVSIDLTTKNLTNCQSTVTTKSILVPRTDDVNASFTAAPSEQTLPSSTVTIGNTTTPGPWQYLWDFGDGTTSTQPVVSSHTYETFGLYTITRTVSNNDCVETASVDVRINPIPPVLDFDYFPPRGCAALTVSFINKSKYADPTSYRWKFGAQEGTSRAVDPTYTYHQAGTYSVTLSATNELGDTVRLTKENIVDVRPNPVAQFAVYPTTPVNVPGEVVYTDNRSINASAYIWDFGDGYTSSDVEPQHKYTKEGSYDITLIASNGDGCADTTVVASAVQAVNHGQLLIPNAFVPNKSGPGSDNRLNNEVFLPLVQKVTKFQMLIFNRWGQLVFQSTSPDVGWDGYYKGRLCAQDVYIYQITAEYENGRTVVRTGDVNLIR
jgi:gliding motility-associated-like protein